MRVVGTERKTFVSSFPAPLHSAHNPSQVIVGACIGEGGGLRPVQAASSLHGSGFRFKALGALALEAFSRAMCSAKDGVLSLKNNGTENVSISIHLPWG